MELTSKQRQKVRTALESILRADYISIDQLDQLSNLERYYIDFYNNISGLLQKQDNYVAGRRGTGKTTLLIRGYYECLKTIAPKLKDTKSEFFEGEKILPIYIDLSNCNEVFSINDNPNLIEIHFVRQIIDSLKRQLEVMFDESFLIVFKKENPALEDLDYIERLLVQGVTLSTGKNVSVAQREKYIDSDNWTAKLSQQSAELGGSVSSSEEIEKTAQFHELRGLNIQEFLNKINDIRKKAGIDSIFVFVDEFSDLNSIEQENFSRLLKNFLGSKINMFFKIGVITDRYDFGDKILIGRDIFPIPLDLNEYVERYGGAVPAIKKMQEFIEQLVEKRLQIFCNDIDYTDVFKIRREDLYHRLAREALGIPRTIGLVLQNSWVQSQSDSSGDRKIGIQELNYGMRSARKIYFKQFQGSVKRRITPGFYMDLWISILEKALSERAKYPDRPASHILIDPVRKDYLNIYCENFLIHFLEENRASKYGGNYNLYSLDYDLCLEHNIKYAEDKDEFTSIRFVYDSILTKYDAYFAKDQLKSYRCKSCNKIYDERDVSQFKVKRCFQDDTILEEIIHQEAPKTEGNYAEVEIKILGLISMLNENEAMSAQETADAVGCSWQKIAGWGSRVLAKKNLINIIQKENKNYYYSID